MRRWTVLGVAGVALFVVSSPPVAAHDGETSIVLLPAQARAGATIEVLGEDLDPDAGVDIVVVTAAGPTGLATLSADADGHFQTDVELPSTLDARAYEVQARVEGVTVASAFVRIEGTAEASGGDTTMVVGVGLVLALAVGVLLVRRHS